MVGETAFPSPSEQSGATARPWGGRLVGMGTKKADRSSISKLEIGSETVMGDSRSAQNPKEEVEGARQRASASGEGGNTGIGTGRRSPNPPPYDVVYMHYRLGSCHLLTPRGGNTMHVVYYIAAQSSTSSVPCADRLRDRDRPSDRPSQR